MRDVRRGVAQFPYIWVGALSDGGQREIIIVLLRCRPVLTAGRQKMDGWTWEGGGDVERKRSEVEEKRKERFGRYWEEEEFKEVEKKEAGDEDVKKEKNGRLGDKEDGKQGHMGREEV